MSLKHRAKAWLALRARYVSIWQHVWKQRRSLTLPELRPEEAEFLPAALAVQARPVSPTARWSGRILMLMVAVLITWAVLGNVDIIVNAQGKIIPSERTKSIATMETANVRAVHVREGQFVQAGDPLIDLDTRAIEAEADKSEGEWQSAWLQAARSRALLQALTTGQAPLLHVPADLKIDAERRADAERHLQDQWHDFAARRGRIDGEIRRYGEALPLVKRRANDFAELLKTSDVSEHAWQEKEQQRIDLEGALRDAQNQQAALLAETRKNAQEALNEGLRVMSASRQDTRRAFVHSEQLRLKSPVDGTVQQLVAHTIGAAVPAAQALMQIVPVGGTVEMEAFLENRDVGFVQEGQGAAVKIDAFEYTKYGTVPARVVHVSRDAIADEKRGLLYSVKVELLRPEMVVDGRTVDLAAGMSGSVEIRTGTRRVIEYVLAPLIQHGRESLRER